MLSTEMIEAVLPEAEDHDSVNSDMEDYYGNKFSPTDDTPNNPDAGSVFKNGTGGGAVLCF